MKKLIIDQADFRRYEWEWDNIRKLWFSVCEELVAGRWEGFVVTREESKNA